jgi:hypothetical protein
MPPPLANLIIPYEDIVNITITIVFIPKIVVRIKADLIVQQ